MNVIDLFSGCGGLSYGFVEAGCDVIVGVDNDMTALKTFEQNHPNSKGLNLDLFNEKFIDELEKEVGNRKVDIIVGGPPCQGFSLTGTRNEEDPRNKLYKAMFITAERFKPKAILIENVPSIEKLYGGKFYDLIISEFEKNGNYNFESKILYAPDYGVPQIRRRIFFIGIRKDIGEVSFPEKTNNPENYVTCSDAISDLPSLEFSLGEEIQNYSNVAKTEYQKLMRKNSDKIFNHIATSHTDEVKRVISLVPDGGNYKDLPEGVGTSRKFNEAWTRYSSKKPSKTIDTGHRNHFHYKYNRIPTVRENARLQSFPDNFIFIGNKTQQYRQVGNAVPPLLSYNIAKEILKTIGDIDEKA